jgi:hypothetical protein
MLVVLGGSLAGGGITGVCLDWPPAALEAENRSGVPGVALLDLLDVDWVPWVWPLKVDNLANGFGVLEATLLDLESDAGVFCVWLSAGLVGENRLGAGEDASRDTGKSDGVLSL